MYKLEIVARSMGLRLISLPAPSHPSHQLYEFITMASTLAPEHHTQVLKTTIPATVDTRVSWFRARNGVMSFVQGYPQGRHDKSLTMYRICHTPRGISLSLALEVKLRKRILIRHRVDVSQDLVVLVYAAR